MNMIYAFKDSSRHNLETGGAFTPRPDRTPEKFPTGNTAKRTSVVTYSTLALGLLRIEDAKLCRMMSFVLQQEHVEALGIQMETST